MRIQLWFWSLYKVTWHLHLCNPCGIFQILCWIHVATLDKSTWNFKGKRVNWSLMTFLRLPSFLFRWLIFLKSQLFLLPSLKLLLFMSKYNRKMMLSRGLYMTATLTTLSSLSPLPLSLIETLVARAGLELHQLYFSLPGASIVMAMSQHTIFNILSLESLSLHRRRKSFHQ